MGNLALLFGIYPCSCLLPINTIYPNQIALRVEKDSSRQDVHGLDRYSLSQLYRSRNTRPDALKTERTGRIGVKVVYSDFFKGWP